MKKTFVQKTEELKSKIHASILKKVEKSKTESNVTDDICIKLKKEFDFRSNDGESITIKELNKRAMIDYRDLDYNYDTLTVEAMAELADIIKA